MSCLCIEKYKFDLSVSSKGRDCKSIIIDDISTWIGEGNKPETIKVKVYIPSQDSTYVFNMSTSKKNLLTSKELMGTSEAICLPDDIYCFTLLDHCGFDEMLIQRAFLCSLNCKISEVISSSDTEEEEANAFKLKRKLDKVNIALEGGLIEESTVVLDNLREEIKSLTCESC